MKLEDLPKEALAPGQRVTLLFQAWTDGKPYIVHGTTAGIVQRGFNLHDGGWSEFNLYGKGTPAHFLLYKMKRCRRETATNIAMIKAVAVGWKTLGEMTHE